MLGVTTQSNINWDQVHRGRDQLCRSSLAVVGVAASEILSLQLSPNYKFHI